MAELDVFRDQQTGQTDIVEDPLILESTGQPDIPDLEAESPVEDISSDVESLEVVQVPAPSVNSQPLVILDYHNTLEHFGVLWWRQ